MNNEKIRVFVEESLGVETDEIDEIPTVNKRDPTHLYKISTSERELVLKKFSNKSRFERSVFAYENVKEKEIPELVSLDKENHYIIIPFYENNPMDWSDERMAENLINSTIRSHKRMHKVGEKPPLERTYNELVEIKKKELLKRCEGDFEKYREPVKEITKILKERTDGIRREFNYNDSHIGNFIISEDGTIEKLLDWEHSSLSPIIEEISKIRYGMVDLPSKFVDTNLDEIYKEKRVYVPREETINLWVCILALSSYISTIKDGPLCDEYIDLAGSKEDLVKAQEEIVEELLDETGVK